MDILEAAGYVLTANTGLMQAIFNVLPTPLKKQMEAIVEAGGRAGIESTSSAAGEPRICLVAFGVDGTRQEIYQVTIDTHGASSQLQ